MKMMYRPDVDGLRAVAVLLVVLFHAGFQQVSGGFVGVDIFFVISGYLITSIIIKESRSETFSFARFYERRARRILPALYFMMVIVLLVTWFIQVPSDMLKTVKTAVWALFFSSNIYFWRTTDYFSSDSDFEFLLHTWSLGVEEQFYFLFPIVLLLLIKKFRLLITLCIVVTVFSFLLSVYATYNYEWASYYLLPSRGWQLAVGALLAIYPAQHILSVRVGNAIALLAVTLLMVAAFLFDKNTRFPGAAALLPTLGAAILIYLGRSCPSNIMSRFLSYSPLVFVGLISYSLYLWHWPVFAFLRNYEASVDLPLLLSLAGLAFSFVMAYLSWKFIERPFRNREKMSLRKVCLVLGSSSIALVAFCLWVIVQQGVPSRIDPDVVRLSSVSNSTILGDVCLNKKSEHLNKGDICFVGEMANEKVSVALWGDSHLGALKSTLSSMLEEEGKKAAFLGKIGCPPLPGVLKTSISDGVDCLDFNDSVLNYIQSTGSIKTVLLHARWPLSVEGTRYLTEQGPKYELKYEGQTGLSNAEIVSLSLHQLVSQLVAKDKNVIIVSAVPEVGYQVPKVMANNLFWRKNFDIRPQSSQVKERQASTIAILKSIDAKFPSVSVIYPENRLCSEEVCRISEDGKPLYFDDDHLSDQGAEIVLGPLKGKIL